MKSHLCRAFVILVSILPWSLSFAADRVYLIYGDSNHPPYSYLDENNKPSGIYTRIVQKVMSQMTMDITVELRLVPWKRAVAYMEHGNGFALYPPHFFPERRPFLWPYSLPILEEIPVAYCHKDKIPERPLKWPDSFIGLTFGLSAGVKMGGPTFWDAVENGQIETSIAQSAHSNLTKIIRGRVDCHINDRRTLQWLEQTMIQAGEIGAGASPLVEAIQTEAVSHGFLAYSANHDSDPSFQTEFARQFDTILYQMQRSGAVESIISDVISNKNP